LKTGSAHWSRLIFGAAFGVVLTVVDPCVGQQSVSAPSGVAVGGNIEHSSIIINNQNPVILAAMAKTFGDQMTASAEARAKAEAKAGELSEQLGFTKAAVAEFFKILGEQNVPEEKIQARLAEIAAHSPRRGTRWRHSIRTIRTPRN
jgi:hypothetical protein